MHKAILLLGPTGSGKTPLGQFLEQHGLWGRRCIHFDFGRQLREIADGRRSTPDLTGDDTRLIRRVLQTGELLEENHFAVARKILSAFIAENNAGPDDLLVLNGLPRHPGQAADLAPLLQIGAVIYLSCAQELALDRIRTNAGGDRQNREDDDATLIQAKRRLFEERSLPLIDFYRARGVRTHRFSITADTTPDEIWNALDKLNLRV